METAKNRIDRKKECGFLWWILVIAIGSLLRVAGFPFESVDYQECLSSWTAQLKAVGTIRALSAWSGDYNYPYITILYFLTLLPIPSLYGIKLVSVAFDFLEAGVLSAAVYSFTDKNQKKALFAFCLVFCNPLAVINSGYLAQCESIWTSLALLAFYLILIREKPGAGMFAFGMAIGFKLQAIFILPILLMYYFYKKSFSILNMIWIPIAIEVLCIPAMIGGCGVFGFLTQYKNLMGEYPFLFYYYPNIWTFFQGAPYYVFGKIAVVFTFGTLLVFAILLLQRRKRHSLEEFFVYAAWTAMTCAMLLPCMHERYNYMAEMMLPVAAIWQKKLRLPAVFLLAISTQCMGQQFLDGWRLTCPYPILAVGNCAIYFYFSALVFLQLKNQEEQERAFTAGRIEPEE